jgi:predicted nucleic acid-binding protein
VIERFVLDTSAFITLDEREPGSEEVETILAKAWLGEVEVHASFATLTELEYIRTQERDAMQATELLTFVKAQPVKWQHTDEALCSEAAKVKAAKKLSFADAFVAATAQRLGGTLVHKDPEFQTLAGMIKLHGLPAKGKTTTTGDRSG